MADYRQLPALSLHARSRSDPTLLAELSTGLQGLDTPEVRRRFARDGPNLLPEQTSSKLAVFLRYYWGVTPMLLWVVIVVQVFRPAWMDFAMLLFLQLVNGLLNLLAARTYMSSTYMLHRAMRNKARVKRNGEWVNRDVSELVIGDRVYVQQGDVAPADLKLVSGEVLEIDPSRVTGEKALITKFDGDEVMLGCIVTKGSSEAIVTATGKNVSHRPPPAREVKGELEKIFFRLAMSLGLGSTLIVLIILFAITAEKGHFLECLSFCMVLLLACLPIAIDVFSNTTVAIGAKQMATHGSVVTHLAAMESLASIHVLCVSKTSILTKATLEVMTPISIGSYSPQDIYLYASLACHRDGIHPSKLDESILSAAMGAMVPPAHLITEEFTPFDPNFKRTEAVIRNSLTGETFKVSKGAPQVILAMTLNRLEIEELVSKLVTEQAILGYKVLGIAKTDSMGHWELIGLLPIHNPIREGAVNSLSKATKLGVKLMLVTGDQMAIAKVTAERVKIGPKINNSEWLDEDINEETQENKSNLVLNWDGFAEMYPEDKWMLTKYIQENKLVVGYTGSTVHDVPVLKQANVGIAVVGACDAAKEASSVILFKPGVHIIVESIFRARKVLQRVKNYIIYRLACSVQLLFFFFTSMLTIDPSKYQCSGHSDCHNLPDSFILSVSSIVVIIVLNDLAVLALSYDLVLVSNQPEKWNFTAQYAVAVVLGLVAMASSWVLLLLSLNNMNDQDPQVVLHYFQVPTFAYGEVMTLIWLKVSVSDYLTLWNARTQSYLWTRDGGRLVVTAFFLASIISCLTAA